MGRHAIRLLAEDSRKLLLEHSEISRKVRPCTTQGTLSSTIVLLTLQARNLAKAATAKFFKMYQEPYFPFTSLTNTSIALGLTETTNTLSDVLTPLYPF